jgi:diguanylate cyclase (GGDEF)-like protein
MRVATQLRLKAAHDRLRLAAALDPLTGLANRRAFDDALRREWRRCLRSGQRVSLLAMLVVRARHLNNHYGHGTGDRCLAAVAGQLRDSVRRPFDVVARYGGDDFMVLLPETDSDGALRVGRRMGSAVAAMALADGASEASLVTVSIGATSYDAACSSWLGGEGAPFTVIDPGVEAADLLAAADLALHVAKRRGGAQQCFRSIDAAVDAKLSAA